MIPIGSCDVIAPSRNWWVPRPIRRLIFLICISLTAIDGAKSQPPKDAMQVTLSGRQILITAGTNADGFSPEATLILSRQTLKAPFGRVSVEEPRQALSEWVAVRDDFLLIRSDCRCSGWRGINLAEIFAINHTRLVDLGNISDQAQNGLVKFYPELSQPGVFIDLDNPLELNELTSHAGAPAIFIVRREQNGRLLYDPSWCWRVNESNYHQGEHDLEIEESGTDTAFDPGPILSLAVIDKYCDRRDVLRSDLIRARHLLSPTTYSKLTGILAGLRIGRTPDH